MTLNLETTLSKQMSNEEKALNNFLFLAKKNRYSILPCKIYISTQSHVERGEEEDHDIEALR